MGYIRITKEILKEWVEKNMATHSDWTGTRVETKHKCGSTDEFVKKLYKYLEEQYI